MIKDLITKLLNTAIQQQPANKGVTHEEVEALVNAKLKEHAAAAADKPGQSSQDEDFSLTDKQIVFALSLLEKVKDYELSTDPANLTLKDLNKLIAFNRFKNKGILVNLEKKGVLKRK